MIIRIFLHLGGKKVSKIFSLVELETNTKLNHKCYMPGIPDWQDIEKCEKYQKVLEKYKDIKFIDIKLSSYCYGNCGGIKSTTRKDLEYISSLENFEGNEEISWLQNYKFTIYPHGEKL